MVLHTTMTPMTAASTISLPIAILIFAGGAGCGVFGFLAFGAGSPRSGGEQAHDAEIVAITTAIQQLARDIRVIADRSDSRTDAAAPARETALPASRPGGLRGTDANDKLILAIDRLVFALGGSGGNKLSGSLAVNAGTPIPTQQIRTELFTPILELDYDIRSRKHHFMTYQQIIDVYGMPDLISESNNGLSFDYNIKEGTPEHMYIQFRFSDGFCIRVDG